MTQRFDDAADRLARAAAGRMNRRRALRNAGGAALGLALATTYSGSHAGTAEACSWSSVCGPSPLCPGTRCNGYNCNTGYSDTKWQVYRQAVCGTTSDKNCWTACSAGGNLWQCCDCCRQGASCGSTCSGCGGTGWRTCICHGSIGNC